jgi:citrate synthase
MDTVLRHGDTQLSLPAVQPSEGPAGFHTGKLLRETGLISYDPGLVSTGTCSSAITFIDGEAGALRYRGYPIEQLAEHSTFLETSFLLIHGELPTPAQLEDFTGRIRKHTLLHEEFKAFFSSFPRDAHPMPVLASAVSALSTYYQDSLDPFDAEQVETSTVRLLAKLPTIAAYAHKKSCGQPFLYPDNAVGYVQDFLRMTFGVPAEPYSADPAVARVLDMLLILHADHEQSCSTSTVRLVGSSRANLFASVAAGVAALGPLHGGANQAALEMLERLRASGEEPAHFLRRVKDEAPGVRLTGFGHRVYRNHDPRATIAKRAARQLLERAEKVDPLLDIAMRLEEVVLADDYFVERRLYPNLDFYSGILFRAMGFPTSMFTVLFALGRLPGWIAQWREMVADPDTRLGRPRQVYTGPAERAYGTAGRS